MAVSYRQGLSILELIVYIPALAIALLMGSRHGFGRSAGWYFFILFSLARIIGNGCYLGTINHNDNESLYIAYGVCNAIGLSPLLLGLLAAQSRLNVRRQTGSAYWPIIFKITSLITVVAMILSIVGMTTAPSLLAGLDNSKTKAGMVIYMVIWAIIVTITCLIWARTIEKGEHRLLYAIIATIPFLLVRLVYSALAIFKHDDTFNMFTGNTTVFLVMDVLEEIIIVYIILLTGLTLQVRESFDDAVKTKGQVAGGLNDNVEMLQQQQEQQLDAGGSSEQTTRPRYKKRPYKGTPLMMLFAWITNTIKERRQ